MGLDYRNAKEQRCLRVAARRKILLSAIGSMLCIAIAAIPIGVLIVPTVVEIVHDHGIWHDWQNNDFWKNMALGIGMAVPFLLRAIMGIAECIRAVRDYHSG